MPPIPRPHAFHLQLPPHHRAPKDQGDGLGGLPYVTIHAYSKAQSIWKLVKSLEIGVGLYCEVAAKRKKGDNRAEDDEGDDDVDDGEEVPKTMLELVKKCSRLHTQLTSLYALKHNGFTQFELCQIILKVLTLLSATVDVRVEKESGTHGGVSDSDSFVDVQQSVSAMAIDDTIAAHGNKQQRERAVSLHFDNMGCIVGGKFTDEEESDSMLKTLSDGRRVIDFGEGNDSNVTYSDNNNDNINELNLNQAQQHLEKDLTRPLALPSPAREALLSVALLLLSKKEQLRSVSNSAIFHTTTTKEPHQHDKHRWMLILDWRSLLRMLLRTAPYLDEHKTGTPPMNSASRTNAVLKRTVKLIRSSRRFFDQGIRPPGYNGQFPTTPDASARVLWSNLKSDLLYHTHSNSCFRALILLYLFQPSKCSSAFYLEVMPQWMSSWSNVDRCPEFDFLWMVMFCRARKYVGRREYDWGGLRRLLLTHAGYWLQIPVGGVSSDKSFPRVGRAGKRSFPRSLKLFVGADSSYEEGIDFVAKMSKLLMFCCGPHDAICIGNVDDDFDMISEKDTEHSSKIVSEGTTDILRFFLFVKPYFNPSNVGAWTFPLGAFLHYFSYELCHRIGVIAALKTLREEHPDTITQLCIVEPYLNCINIPGHEIVAFLNNLLPLCQQALYSKNGTVSHAGETALLYLAQVDPARVSPPMIDFSLQALGVSSVNLSHQAPAALSALSRLLQPALRHKPSIILSRLPQMLQLTLAGIDSNDQNKTTRTLIFYRNLLMWIPCGGAIPSPNVNQEEVLGDGGHDGIVQVGMNLMDARYSIVASSLYEKAVNALPPNSVFTESDGVKESQTMSMLMQEAMMAMSDWSLSFLDRIFELLRAAGEQEKHGKLYGPGSSHASADVALAKNVSRILKETLTFFFASMDEETYLSALRCVTSFISDETLPLAVKDASILCQAVASTRFEQSGVDRSPGLDALVPILTEDLEHRSNKSAVYRLRCLAGAVRYGGRTLLTHSNKISCAIAYAISKSDDKVLLKAGCKLLRHTLASQCEEYPIAQCFHPIRVNDEHKPAVLGASARLCGDRILWHIPSGDQIDFCVDLLDRFALSPLKNLGNVDHSFSLQQWRQCLRLLRYSLRGCIGLLLDDTPDAILLQEGENCPREKATAVLIQSASVESKKILYGLRRRLCLRLIDIMSLIATDTVDCESKLNAPENGQKTKRSPLSSDPKVCSEVLELSDLLLTRRGAHHKSSKSIWRGQKEILSDFVLSSMSNYIMSFRSRLNDELFRGADSFYKDGEDGGKTVSRALLVNRIDLAMQSLTGAASTQIPRRLRKLRGPPSVEARAQLFSLGMTFERLQSNLVSDAEPVYALEAYEGLIDSLCAMTCHPNINVRGDAIGVVEFVFSRYGWVIKPRISRFLAAISLRDEDQGAKFGILSCAQLVGQVNSQGKRTRLAETVKGVTKLLGSPKVISGLLSTEENRFRVAERLCSTQRVQSLLPDEEVAKFVTYMMDVFLSIRSRFYSLPRATVTDQMEHESCLIFLLDALADNPARSKGTLEPPETDIDATSDESGTGDMHWKNRLVAAWLLTSFMDEVDLVLDKPTIMSRVWSTCFKLIEEEAGQPLQRVSLGLLGRLVSLALVDMSQSGISAKTSKFPDVSILRDLFIQREFCRHFAFALAFDHREDNSVGGGHSAQWSSGVDEILRDANSNLAPVTLYPFQRISQTSSTFKIQHCQLVEGCDLILLAIGQNQAKISAGYLLAYGIELVASPPSEDQRNQLVASAEIFAGVSRALLKYSIIDEEASVWDSMLLPFLDEAVPMMPTAFISAFFDAVRYGIHHFPPRFFHSLLRWCVIKVQGTLWQHGTAREDVDDSGKLADRFTLQSKYLLLVQAVLIELDSDDDTGAACQLPWFTNMLVRGEENSGRGNSLVAISAEAELGQSWQYVSSRLTPYLLNAIGHPYEKCRDHIASCLFRMCYCHRKFLNKARSQGTDNESTDPGIEILKDLQSIRASQEYSFKEKIRALGTTRKFVACCIHWGDAKHEFSESIIPLLPLAFECLQPIGDEVSPENHGLEADLVKGFRYAIADISSSCVITYGVEDDVTRVLTILKTMAKHECWQVRQASAHFLRFFQGNHKFLLSDQQEEISMSIALSLLADDRREVSSAAMSVLTGIIAILPEAFLNDLVSKYIIIANKSLKKKKHKTVVSRDLSHDESVLAQTKEKERATMQQKSVFFLCAVIMSRPYDVPRYVPKALEALSKHSFEQRASLGVREIVKMCCSEFKRTHTDNWEAHRKQFTQVQLEALDDVVSTPHYYA